MKVLYRPEIDGLRAIAIIFIILSHFKQLHFVSGGVNIFFVISGYFITHILLNQQLDISKFYKNRFLKLYPNLFIISLITLILFFFTGDFAQWSEILRSFVTTISGLFNLYLIKIGDVYGQDNYINPFLPFWAFCIIIQFYIIFPIVLKIIFFTKRKFNFNDNFIIISLFAISVVLFLFNFYFRDNSFFSFYSPLSRYWQFILGACLYFVIQFKKKLHYNNLAIYFAVILIIIWQLNLEWFYAWRKVQVLLTISTLLFLYSAPHPNSNIFNKILSIKLLTSIGKFSFELYLIHMSVIYFISLWFEQGVIILSLILLVIITYFFIKFFNQSLLQKINFIFSNKLIIFSSIIFILINLSVYFYDKNLLLKKEMQFKNFFSSINPIEKIKINFENKYKDSYKISSSLLLGKDDKPCYPRKFDEEFLENCSFIDIENNKNFFLVGGSQISSLGYNLKQRLRNFSYSHFSSSAFIYLPGFYKINKKNNSKDEEFSKINNSIRNILLSVNKKSIVLIGARYPLHLNQSYFDNKEGGVEGKEWHSKFQHSENLNINWQIGFKNSIKELSINKNISVILVYPIPEVGFDISTKLKNKFFSNKLLDTSFDVFKERTKSSFELLDSIQGENIYRVYPHTLFCDTTIKNRCVTHEDKNIFYSDDNHPSIKGSEMINDLIIKEIEKIELKSN